MTREDETYAQPMAMGGLPGFSGFERLGAGGLGDVYVATRDSTGAKVAVKVLRDWSDSSVGWVRTRRELQALVQLQGHPNVVHVEEVLESEGVPHIVMEFAPAGSVFERCTRAGGRLPLVDVAVIGEHTAAALTAAHRLGILHLDVKPHNLLIGGFGQVKLCDFGISALTTSEEFRQHTNAISTRYASPEQFAEQPVGPASDVYMLGATLGHLATGILPNQRFGGGADAWATNWPPDPSGQLGVSQELYRLVSLCSAHDPTLRPAAEVCRSAFAALADRLLHGQSHVLTEEGATQIRAEDRTAVRGGQLGTATHVITPHVPQAAARRRSFVGAIVTAAFALVALVVAAVVWLNRDSGTEGADTAPPTSGREEIARSAEPPSTALESARPTTVPTTTAAPTTPPPTSSPEATTTSTAAATSTTAVPVVQPVVTAAAATVPRDLSAAAQQSLTNYFTVLASRDFDQAYTYWSADSGQDYVSFVDWWGNTVEWWDHSIEQCRPAANSSICTVLLHFTYGSVDCAGARVDLTMVPGSEHFLIAQQATLDDGLAC